MNTRTGTVVAIEDGFAVVRVAIDGPHDRLVHVPQQVLPTAAVGGAALGALFARLIAHHGGATAHHAGARA